MKNIYFCFGCLEEFNSREVTRECVHCGSCDIVDITEKAKKRNIAHKCCEGLSMVPTNQDVLDWKYGNDYGKYVR